MTADAAPLLAVRELCCSYGPLQVLFGVDLDVAQGERVALLGTNGAGKSTLLRAISGLLAPDSGSVEYRGVDITREAPDRRVHRGIIQMAGGRGTFPTLTVEENLRLGGYRFSNQDAVIDGRLAEVVDLFPALGSRLEQQAGNLSGGEQQMMALGRALIAEPELLMIDELSLGLAPVVMQEILAMVHELARRGVTLLIVEQSLNVACALTEKAFFLEKGEVRFSGKTQELLDRGDLARSVFFGAGVTGED